ncbi:hypothetical protein QJQ45_009533 [Haematococcus lacustris]|nr:hypothetical protein QJQ45_009533 [Haematococcus lacustris]
MLSTRRLIHQYVRYYHAVSRREVDTLHHTWSAPAVQPRVEPVLSQMALDKRIGFLGSGQMAEALARGLMAKGIIGGDRMYCSDPNPLRRELFRGWGSTPFESNLDVVRNSDVLFIAVKPQHVFQLLTEVRPVLNERHTIVSIAAGVTVDKLVDAAGPHARVVRVMPNTPCLVGETAAAMCLGGKADASDEQLVRQLFEAVGKIYTVDEKLLAAVTGLSGSGPAYVFMMVEALADGGVKAGLPREIAQALAAQTVLGSAKMVLETGKHPGALKDMVTSPGGTTIAGVHELEKAGVRAAFMSAVVAATNPVFLGTGNFSQGVWKAGAVRKAVRKVVEQPSRPGLARPDRLVIVDEFRTTRVSSSVHARQPCELHLPNDQPRPADWVPPAGQVTERLLRPAWSLRHAKEVRGLKWCLQRPQAPPWGRWLDRDTNPCLNFQRIGESMQRPLELCSWKDREALPPIGKEYQQRYKRVNDRLPKVRQRLHRAAEYRRGIDGRARNNA